MDPMVSRGIAIISVILSLGGFLSVTSERNAQLTMKAKELAIGNERISSPAAQQTAAAIQEGAEALIVGNGGTAITAPSGTLIVDYATGVTAQAKAELTPYGTMGKPTYQFIRVGDPTLAITVGKTRQSARQ